MVGLAHVQSTHCVLHPRAMPSLTPQVRKYIILYFVVN